MRRHGALGLVVALTVGLSGWVVGSWSPRPRAPEDVAPPAGDGSNEGSAGTLAEAEHGGEAPTRGRAIRQRGPGPGVARVSGAGGVEPEGVHDAAAWNRLAPDDRVRELTRRYDAAVDALESGSTDPIVRQIAEEAVSSLRAELYATPRGREHHRRLEQRLVVASRSVETRSGTERETVTVGGVP